MFGKLFDAVKGAVSEISAGLDAEIKKFTQREFLDAAIAVGYVISAADGEIDSDEKKKLRGFIERNEALSVFDSGKVTETFNKLGGEYDFDYDMGNEMAQNMIRQCRGNHDQAHLLMRLVVVIGRADGNFDDDEKAAGREVAGTLGMNPSDYGF